MKYKKILVFITLLLIIPIKVNAKVNMYLFYGDGCPHCAEEEKFFESYLENAEDVSLIKFEVWHSKENQELLSKVQSAINNHSNGVPYLIIGNKPIVGYYEGITDEQIKNTVEKTKKNKKFVDLVQKVIDNEEITDLDKVNGKIGSEKKDDDIKVPILGKVNAKNVSLPLLSVIMGLVDGFNPCAMWILLFLISVLIGMKNKKKLILFGSVFLLTSGLFYFLLMFTWLKAITSISLSLIFRTIIAIFAVGAGLYNLYNYRKSLKKDDGCTVTSKKQRKNIMIKIRKFTENNNILLGLIGIIILAIGVNFVELLCSAGLPIIYTEVLSINKVSGGMSIIYNLIYIIFFMLDDFIIFLIAVKTMNLKVISTKYSKYSHLFSGIIMLIIGILLIFKPGWVMFNF